MINLKRFFQPAANRLSVTRTQQETLEHFIAHKQEFDKWLLLHPASRIRFQFYFPTAIDFYFDDFRLFTAFFKRGAMDTLQLSELKMSRDNCSSIRTTNWKPFEKVIVTFLTQMAEANKIVALQKTRSLYEYVSLCREKPGESSGRGIYNTVMNPDVAAG